MLNSKGFRIEIAGAGAGFALQQFVMFAGQFCFAEVNKLMQQMISNM